MLFFLVENFIPKNMRFGVSWEKFKERVNRFDEWSDMTDDM